MNVYVAGIIAALGVVMILAGIRSSGPKLIDSITGTGTAGAAGASSGAGALPAGYPQHPTTAPHPATTGGNGSLPA